MHVRIGWRVSVASRCFGCCSFVVALLACSRAASCDEIDDGDMSSVLGRGILAFVRKVVEEVRLVGGTEQDESFIDLVQCS
jgi:hypothetical protein